MLKQEITDYRIDRVNKAEDYIADIMMKAESLEDIQMEIKRFLQESNTVTIIAERHIQYAKLKRADSLDTTTGFDCDERLLIENGGMT